MFEPLEAVGQTGGQTHLLGRHVLGRHASTLFDLDFGVWIRFWGLDFRVLILDSGSWILMDFGVWDFGSLILDSFLGFGVLILDSVSWILLLLLLLWSSSSSLLSSLKINFNDAVKVSLGKNLPLILRKKLFI